MFNKRRLVSLKSPLLPGQCTYHNCMLRKTNSLTIVQTNTYDHGYCNFTCKLILKKDISIIYSIFILHLSIVGALISLRRRGPRERAQHARSVIWLWGDANFVLLTYLRMLKYPIWLAYSLMPSKNGFPLWLKEILKSWEPMYLWRLI